MCDRTCREVCPVFEFIYKKRQGDEPCLVVYAQHGHVLMGESP